MKDERFFDTFDLVFENFFKGAMHKTAGLLDEYIPEDWLQGLAREMFSDEEIEAMSFEELMDELAKRLQEQDGAHHGGSRWIGTGGTSPFGNSGQNPVGVRIGGDGGGKSATKMWQKRDFRSLRGETEIGTRNMKMAQHLRVSSAKGRRTSSISTKPSSPLPTGAECWTSKCAPSARIRSRYDHVRYRWIHG